MSLRKISGTLQEAGHLNERGRPFNRRSIKAMVEQSQNLNFNATIGAPLWAQRTSAAMLKTYHGRENQHSEARKDTEVQCI